MMVIDLWEMTDVEFKLTIGQLSMVDLVLGLE